MPALSLSRVGARVVESGVDGVGLPAGAWQRLEALPDPWSPQGRVYPLACLVAVAVCAFTAAGHDRLTAVGQWVKRASQADLARLRAPFDPLAGRYRAPDEKTIRVVLDRLDPRGRWPGRCSASAEIGAPAREARPVPACATTRPGGRRPRTGRRHGLGWSPSPWTARPAAGPRRADRSRVHLLGVCGHDGQFLHQVEVGVKHNETTYFQELLTPLELAGQVVTFDALHTVRANLDWLVTAKGAHYLAVVKRNQPLLYARVKALPWAKIPTGAITGQTGHGREETRTLQAAHVADLPLPHAQQAIRITRRRRDTTTGKTSRETIYAVTTLTAPDAAPHHLARIGREHWTVEANHHVRDVSFTEDHATSRTGHGPANLATIRNAVTNALRGAGYHHIPEGRRDHTAPTDALHLHGLL